MSLVVGFPVFADTVAGMEKAAREVLAKLAPGREWAIQLDVEPAVQSGDGQIIAWQGHVRAVLGKEQT